MKSTKTIIKCSALVLGVLIIPLLYSYFYLDAFWDPYNSLNKMPVAVVNEDKGAVINGENRNLGSELTSRMKKDGTLKWVFTNAQTAREGVDGKKYYAEFVIPADFSGNIASSSTENKKTGVIEYTTNEKHNYLASQILSRAVVVLEEQIRSDVNKEITQSLGDKLKSVPKNLTTLKTGLDQLSSGSASLQDGAETAASSQRKINSGVQSLSGNLKTLSAGSQSLLSGAVSLDSGLGKMAEGVKTLTLQFKPGSKLYNGVTGINSGLSQLSAQLSPGTSGSSPTVRDQVTGGVSKYTGLVSGVVFAMTYSSYQASPATFAASIGILKTEADGALLAYLQNGSEDHYNALVAEVNLYDIYNTFAHSVNASQTQPQAEQAFLSAMMSSSNPYFYKNDSFGAAVSAAVSQINAQNVVASGSAMNSSVTTLFSSLSGSVSRLSEGSQALADQFKAAAPGKDPTLSDSLSLLESNLNLLKDGSSKIVTYSGQLANGASALASGSDKLTSGSAQMTSGLDSLSSGAKQVAGGISQADSSVGDSISAANSQVKALNGLAEYSSKPVTISKSTINPVPNYGTAFAPYFLSLSLYVGALIVLVGIYLDPNEKIKSLSRHSDKRVFRTAMYFVLGVGQAVLLGLVIQFALHLHIKDVSAYYMACILISFVFSAIVQFLIVYLQDVGKFLAIAFLILQLTSCGGTFPMETIPKIFNVLYPYMPMTYSVGLFKEVISGLDAASAFQNAYILFGIFAVFACINVLFGLTRKAKARVERLRSQTEAE